MAAAPGTAARLKAFISYSRRDALEFADQLELALRACGFDTILDRHGITGGEAWKPRLEALIREADTVVFVLSPEAARSEICAWEVEKARALAKRILPVLAMPLGESAPPEHLASLNYVHFYAEPQLPGSGFGYGIAKLVEALNSDIDWLREHTRLLGLASAWLERNKPDSRLLTGTDVADAKTWLLDQPPTAPEPTALQIEFIRASEKEEAERADEARRALAERERMVSESEKAAELARAAQREREVALDRAEVAARTTARFQRRAARLLWGVGALVLALFGGAFWQSLENQRREVQVFASLATQAIEQERYGTAMRLALQAFPPPGAWPWHPTSTALEGKLAGAAMASRLVLTMRGSDKELLGLAVSPDGRAVIITSDDGRASIWSTTTGQRLHELKGHEFGRPIRTAGWSADGKLVATFSEDRTVRLWNGTSGAHVSAILGHRADITTVSFSPTGKHLLTLLADGTAQVWDVASPTVPVASFHHAKIISAHSWSPDGAHVVTASDGLSVMWSAQTGMMACLFDGHEGLVRSVAFDAQGLRLVTGSQDFSARVWSTTTCSEEERLDHNDWVLTARFNADGSRILTTSDDKNAYVWHPRASTVQLVVSTVPALTLRGHRSSVFAGLFTQTGEIVVTASDDKSIRLWDTETGLELATLKGHTGHVRLIAPLLDQDLLASASQDGTARIWRIRNTVATTELIQHDADPSKDYVWGSALSPDRKLAVTAGADATAIVWDAMSGKRVKVLSHPTGVRAVAFDRSSTWIATGSEDGVIRIWDLEPQSVPSDVARHPSSIASIALAIDHRLALTASGDGTVKLWDVSDWKQWREIEANLSIAPDALKHAAITGDARFVTIGGTSSIRIVDRAKSSSTWRLDAHHDAVWSTAISPDGKHLISGSADRTSRIWRNGTWLDPATRRREPRLLATHLLAVNAVAFSPDSRRAVTASSDKTIEFWDVASGRSIVSLRAHDGIVLSASFSRDGDRLITSADDRIGRIWDTSWLKTYGDALRQRVCETRLIGDQDFSREEHEEIMLLDSDDAWRPAANPCRRTGPLAWSYWRGLPASLFGSTPEITAPKALTKSR